MFEQTARNENARHHYIQIMNKHIDGKHSSKAQIRNEIDHAYTHIALTKLDVTQLLCPISKMYFCKNDQLNYNDNLWS